MKKSILLFALAAVAALHLTGCGQSPASAQMPADSTSVSQPVSGAVSGGTESQDNPVSTLTVRFGDRGDAFSLCLEDNDTAEAIARHVGSADWRLPIYHYDDYEGWGNKIVSISPGR